MSGDSGRCAKVKGKTNSREKAQKAQKKHMRESESVSRQSPYRPVGNCYSWSIVSKHSSAIFAPFCGYSRFCLSFASPLCVTIFLA
jgi:hypothetical protein